MNIHNINWNGFLEEAVKQCPKEICGFLFSRHPYGSDERWEVGMVDNIAEDPTQRWIPDKKQMGEVKRLARQAGMVKIGNVHSHPCETRTEFQERIKKYEEVKGEDIELDVKTKMYEVYVEEIVNPSELDLSYAKRFNDIVRGIVAVSKDGVKVARFHDMFNHPILIEFYPEIPLTPPPKMTPDLEKFLEQHGLPYGCHQ